MRRIVVTALLLTLFGIAVGSATTLEVDGGIIQVFEQDADIEMPPPCEGAQDTKARTETEPGSEPASGGDTSDADRCQEIKAASDQDG